MNVNPDEELKQPDVQMKSNPDEEPKQLDVQMNANTEEELKQPDMQMKTHTDDEQEQNVEMVNPDIWAIYSWTVTWECFRLLQCCLFISDSAINPSQKPKRGWTFQGSKSRSGSGIGSGFQHMQQSRTNTR